MFHQAFDARIEGKTKRIGILGECHAYTPRESGFAEDVVQRYSNFGVERVKNKSALGSVLETFAGLAVTPSYLLMSLFYQRSRLIENANDHAKSLGKTVVPLDVEIRNYKMALFPFIILGSMVLSAPNYLRGSFGRKKVSKWLLSKEELFISGNYPPKTNFNNPSSWVLDIPRRDAHMAQTAVDFLREETYRGTPNNLLINCGMLHVPGIRRNLEGLTEDFKLVSTERCN